MGVLDSRTETGENEFWLSGQNRDGRAMICQSRGFDRAPGMLKMLCKPCSYREAGGCPMLLGRGSHWSPLESGNHLPLLGKGSVPARWVLLVAPPQAADEGKLEQAISPFFLPVPHSCCSFPPRLLFVQGLWDLYKTWESPHYSCKPSWWGWWEFI